MLKLFSYIQLLCNIFYLLLFARVLLSWIPHDPNHSFIAFIYRTTEPVLAPFRQFLNQFVNIPIDFSPILVFFALDILLDIILRILRIFH